MAESAKSARVVLVTGASSGIGRATADALHAAGHVVYGGNRNPARDVAWRAIELDVTNDAHCARAIADILAKHGRLDVLINNAGLVYAGAVEDTSIAEAQRQFDINYFGAVRLIRAALPAMRGQGAGLIINISSLAGRLGLPFQAHYSATKFALEGLTEALRPEVAAHGIEVVLVEPGDIATNVVTTRVRVEKSGEGSAYSGDFQRLVALYAKEEAAGSQPEVVAGRIAAIIATSRPAVRYTSGALAQRVLVALKPFFPSRFYESCLMKYYGLRR